MYPDVNVHAKKRSTEKQQERFECLLVSSLSLWIKVQNHQKI